MTSTDSERYERARRRVQEARGFYIHVLVYVVVNAGLFAIDIATGGGADWFYWPLLGWGIGLAAHALVYFSGGRFLGAEWEERGIRQEMEKDDRR